MAFDIDVSRLPRVKPGRRAALCEVIGMRMLCYKSAKLLGQDLETSSEIGDRARIASSIASLAKGWESMQDQLRILKGKPMPGSLRPESTKSKKGKVHTFPTETSE